MEHLEGRQSDLAALGARQRKFEVILISQGPYEEKIREVLEAAEARGVLVKRIASAELDAIPNAAGKGKKEMTFNAPVGMIKERKFTEKDRPWPRLM